MGFERGRKTDTVPKRRWILSRVKTVDTKLNSLNILNGLTSGL